ncbi:MAG TPA: hypothetical protein VII57_06620 [Dehalococcoidia bacterium]
MEEQLETFVRRWVQEGVARSFGLNRRVTNFIEEVLIEGFDERRSDDTARRQLDLDPERSISFSDVEYALVSPGLLRSNVYLLVEEAARVRRGEQVLLIDILEAIHIKWCDSWPFCRPPVLT